jgi:alpha-L-glutamate ligase-like protein
LRARVATLFGINRRNVELVYEHNPRHCYPFADDKALCKERLVAHEVPVPETIALCRGLFEVDAAVALLRVREHFVIKPANGSGGEGILVVGDRQGTGWATPKGGRIEPDQLRMHIANTIFGAHSRQLEDRAIVEERVQPHPFFVELWPDGVCDLRIIVLRGRPLLAMVRVPTRRSAGRANLHQGGIGVAVDLDSGQTTRAMSRGQALTRHPETGGALLGLTLPHFALCVEIARRAAAAVPLGYLGVDLVVDARRGPVVLELNVRPGLEIQNVTGIHLGAAIARGAEQRA